MTIEEIDKKVESNRKEIHLLLESSLPLDIIYFNIRKLASNNERMLALKLQKENELRI